MKVANECEGCFIEVKTKSNQKDLIIGSIYRRAHSENMNSFIARFVQTLQEISSKKYNVLITGDFNINTASNDKIPKYYKDTLSSLGLTNVISKPTRITISSETVLDHILTNFPLKKLDCGVVTHDVSDHLPIFAV